jgi:error-prone DNA polymerase
MICRADTMGVFQIESRAQMSMLPRLQPRKFYDLVIEVAIVRPGPIQGNMVHPYLRRRAGEEAETYPNDAIKEVLHRTLGVPIFQEQAMRLAEVAAGFTPGEADQLRRAMGAWRKNGVIDQFRKKLIDGMLARGLTPEFAENLFNQIRGFGEYGFPESHAASFALLVYASAWLKHYYPAAFCAALINSQPMGFYAPAQLVQDARNHGVCVLPVDVNASDWECTLELSNGEGRREKGGGRTQNSDASRPSPLPPRPSPFALPPSLRLGLRMINGFREDDAHRIMAVRGDRPFTSVANFTKRTKFARAVVSRLARADAFGSLQQSRRQAMWEALSQEKKPRAMPLFDGLVEDDDPPLALPAMPPEEEVFADYVTTGLSLKAHPVSFYRDQLAALGVTAAEDLIRGENNSHVRVAGIVLLRQRPGTAKGITFVTLEDETGTVNLVVHQQTWEKSYTVARRSSGYFVHGRLERKGAVIHVIVERLEDLSARLREFGELNTKSRDFR